MADLQKKSADSGFFDEWYGVDGVPRELVLAFDRWLQEMPAGDITRKRDEADLLFRRFGITFIVYGNEGGTERLIPFDVIPRVFDAEEWRYLEAGSIQRVRALNEFLYDIYHDGEILKAGVVPDDLILSNSF